jgi:hypothetical protein
MRQTEALEKTIPEEGVTAAEAIQAVIVAARHPVATEARSGSRMANPLPQARQIVSLPSVPAAPSKRPRR